MKDSYKNGLILYGVGWNQQAELENLGWAVQIELTTWGIMLSF